MKADERMELTRQLENIRLANEGANSRLLFFLGTVAEMIAAAVCFTFAIRLVADDKMIWAGFLMQLAGLAAIAHGVYLTFNRFMNRRLRLLYESVLDTTGSTQK